MEYEIRLAMDDDIAPALDVAWRMFVKYDSIDGKVVGMLETYGTNRISLFFVDSEYQRKGIATAMMSKIASELKMRGYDKIVLNSSPHGLSFYKHFGFTVEDEERNADTPWKTPMSYIL